MSLYTDIRPTTFDGIIGNKGIVSSLKSFVKMPTKRPHTYLFYGPSGCGKTTLARILAKEFGCVGTDLIEVDAAKDRGVEGMRQIVSDSQYSPMSGECRFFIIDEVHELTRMSQETLLKTTEDTPVTSYFVLCTTEFDKVILTVRNRCSSFQVSRLREAEMEELIERVCKQLNRNVSDKVFFAVIDGSEGSPRKALVLLETVLSIEDEEEQLQLIHSATVESEISEICLALLRERKWEEILELYKGLPGGTEPEMCRRVILGYMKNVMLKGGKNVTRAFQIARCFQRNLFDSGESGLIIALFESTRV